MMMQMLHAGGLDIVTDGVRTPDGSNPRGYFEFEAVKDLDKGARPAWLAGARGKAVKIVSSLVRWLPQSYDYQVIFMQRDLDEVIASQDRMLAERGVPQDGRTASGSGSCTGLMSRRRCGSCAGAAASPSLVVDYRETLAQPERIARRLDRFLGGRLDVARAAAAADPALYRNRRTATGA